MTTVHIDNDDNLVDISITGHAGYGQIGDDIVCAGISALTFALIYTFNAFNADVVDVSDGSVRIQARYDDAEAEYIQGVIDVAQWGYMALADKYPDYLDYNP